jgi:hypothetical protein
VSVVNKIHVVTKRFCWIQPKFMALDAVKR